MQCCSLAGLLAGGVLLAFAACGGVDTPETAAAASATTGTGEPTGGTDEGQPPDRGPDHAGDGPGYVFAMSHIYLGDTNRDGTEDKINAWRQYGYDLDHVASPQGSAGSPPPEWNQLCKLVPGADAADVYPDGEHGLDNSFGRNVLRILRSVSPDAEATLNGSIADGRFTILLDMQELGSSQDYNPLVTRLYGGAPLEPPPAFDGTDAWPVVRELLEDPNDITSAKVVFNQSYVTKGTWVSGTVAPVSLGLVIAGYTLNLDIGSAVMTIDLDPDRKGATNGTIAGILDTEALIEQVRRLAGAIQPSLCDGALVEGVLNQIRQASDIMKDGTQSNAAECNGISIGLGFDAKVVTLGGVADPAVPPADPCAQGTGGGGGGTGGSGGG